MMTRLHSRTPRSPVVLVLLVWATLFVPVAVSHAQIGRIVSPGPLSRFHAKFEGLDNCQKCHEPGRQVGASRCLACHRPIAERIASHTGVHRDTKDDCARCHAEHRGIGIDIRPIKESQFNHAAETGFPLDGRHAPLARNCAKCHKARSFLAAVPACASCHADIHKGALGPKCATCHEVTAAFADARKRFDHSRAKFLLAGAHRTVDCAKCHVNKVYAGLRFSVCTDCHREPHRQAFGNDCAACHSNDAWKTRKVDHARTTFPLKGAHAAVACTVCHVRPAVQVRLNSERCRDCHADVHRGQFAQDCRACHTEAGWRTSAFDHATSTKYALAGKHVGVACVKCHKAASAGASARTVGAAGTAAIVFRGASSACASCHEDVHRGGTSPQCETCHDTSGFRAQRPYAHAAPLAGFFKGRHAAATCTACHGRQGPMAFSAAAAARSGEAPAPQTATQAVPIGAWSFRSTGTACAACHADPHAGQFGTSCERCHAVEESRFTASRFSHASTLYPLTGKHERVDCVRCHRRGEEAGQATRYKGTGTTCTSCHGDPHLGQVGGRCNECHTTDGFKLPKYRHRSGPGRVLAIARHATLACEACHKKDSGAFPAGRGAAVRYAGVATACAACHAKIDAHRGELGSACETCHTPERWLSASRAFHKSGLFPLEGRHLAVPCASCHVNGAMSGTPTKCVDCHWVRQRDDPYQTRLGTECESCHRPTSWTAVSWNHAARTGFAMNVAHQLLRCNSCHKDGRFAGTSINCVGCHRENYQRTSQPNHAAAGFPLNCELCHQVSQPTWRGGSFNHASWYQLVGGHASQACAACHRNGVYAGTPRDCAGCHQADYQKTKSPNHAAASFPIACETCHRATDPSWASGSFNHAAVFALVGVHATQQCAACHVNGVYKGTPRDCFGCHQANYLATKNPNHAAAGFPTTCDSCHRVTDASWASGTFNHASVFALVGVHATQLCAACHVNGVYKGTPRTCVGCHQQNYQNSANPNHIAAGFPTTCETCHQATDSTWQQGRFTHTWFPITSGRHTGNACSACHTTPNVFVAFSCTTSCHARATVDSHHGSVSGYRYDSAACYSCHPNGRAGAPRPRPTTREVQ